MGSSAYDNPAGRLHGLLVRLGEVRQGTTLLDAWKSVLGASESDMPGLLAGVGALVGEVEKGVAQTNSEGHAKQVSRFRGEWEVAIFPRDRPFTNAVQEFRPSEQAIDVLQSAAELLHRDAPEGRALEEGELETLRLDVEDLIEAVKAADDVPEQVKQLAVARLRDVIRALDHIDVGGPGAVKLATEALAGAIDLGGQPMFGSHLRNRFVSTIVTLYAVFGVPATIQAGLPAWDKTIHELMPSVQAHVASSHEPAPVSGPEPPAELPAPSAHRQPR